MLPRLLLQPQPGERALVSRAFPSWKRSILTEICLCHACFDHEIEGGNARAGHLRRARLQDSAAARGSAPLAGSGGGRRRWRRRGVGRCERHRPRGAGAGEPAVSILKSVHID
eukprot:COSAG01_NODE_160_length_23692_cov_9.703599_18_plen_113_part_00